MLRALLAYFAAVATTCVFASGFYTQQVIAKQAAIGAEYTLGQQAETYFANFKGLVFGPAPSFSMILAVALAIGFVVAALVKRILPGLAAIAYPTAGAASVFTTIYLIENVLLGGGVGAIGGARDAVGMALQALAGGLGGLAFSLVARSGR